MYSNNKNCGEAQKIKPSLVSALKLYDTSIYCAIQPGRIATLLWKIGLRSRKPNKTPSFNHVLIFINGQKKFQKNYDNCGWSDYENCGWHCDNCGFFWQLWLVLRIAVVGTILVVGTIVITSGCLRIRNTMVKPKILLLPVLLAKEEVTEFSYL